MSDAENRMAAAIRQTVAAVNRVNPNRLVFESANSSWSLYDNHEGTELVGPIAEVYAEARTIAISLGL